MILLYGLITGLFFGFLLHKGGVLEYDKQVGALRFQDMTILKFMLSAILVAMIGLYLFSEFIPIKFSIKATVIGAQVIGGTIFGIGWAILGYCPGTAVGAIAEGKIDALFGIIGMLVGGAVFASIYHLFTKNILALGKYGKITFHSATGINHWFFIVGFACMVLALFYFFEKKKL
jgi:uncharacterized membrane protein YedE/YeeE